MSRTLSLAELESFDSHATRGGRERRFCCPMCGTSKPLDMAHRSIAVNTDTGAWVCHRCGSKGKLTEWRERREARSWQERRRAAIKAKFDVSPKPQPKLKPEDEAKIEKLQARYDECAASFADSEAARYLADRGIAESIATAAGCGYAAQWMHWERQESNLVLLGKDQRVVFPVRDRSGNLVAVATRAINPEHFGSKAITRGPKSLGVFATEGALQAEITIITEAPIDALSLAMAGYPAIALIGTSWPEWLRRHCGFRTVLIATDADQAGDDAAEKLAAELRRMGARCLRLRPAGGKDWNEVLLARGADFISARIAELLGHEPKKIEEPQPYRQDCDQDESVVIGNEFKPEAASSSPQQPEWDSEMDELIRRVFATALPTEPFLLCDGHFIKDPRRWYAALLSDIANGPSGPRARTGALRHALQALRKHYT